ncbi:hypothetical protein JTE90_027306 [Oedothorax gibbosus]|uniref:Uncharacterized protein n=1 Tax=Oedothorax gibbosus TaxID=931172 RepID=A0AAV6W3J9_9ARAC|nr:hypothetical protein JTE90_027306 [Oedothorax gibbosus]
MEHQSFMHKKAAHQLKKSVLYQQPDIFIFTKNRRNRHEWNLGDRGCFSSILKDEAQWRDLILSGPLGGERNKGSKFMGIQGIARVGCISRANSYWAAFDN